MNVVLLYLLLNLTFQATTPQNGQTHSNNPLTVVDELFECV